MKSHFLIVRKSTTQLLLTSKVVELYDYSLSVYRENMENFLLKRSLYDSIENDPCLGIQNNTLMSASK